MRLPLISLAFITAAAMAGCLVPDESVDIYERDPVPGEPDRSEMPDPGSPPPTSDLVNVTDEENETTQGADPDRGPY